MMHHITSKSATKQVFRNVLSTAGKRQTIAGAQRIALVPSNMQGMSFFVVNKNS